MNEEKIKRYLTHLDREGLMQIIMFIVNDASDGLKTLEMMSEEWDRMYGIMSGDEE